ncbi:MAG: phage tail sheath C-terminal domain-containing protein [Opitutales bacterium]
MPNYSAPDIYVEEVAGGARPIEAVGTSTAGFVGITPDPDAYVNEARAVNNWSRFIRDYCKEESESTALSHAVYGFYANGGTRCYVVNVGPRGSIAGGGRNRAGLDLLEQVDEVAIVAAPGYTDAASYDALLSHCERLENRVAILDAPEKVEESSRLTEVAVAKSEKPGKEPAAASEEGQRPSTGLRPRQSDGGYGAFYFPWIRMRDPMASNKMVDVAPSGHIAGIWARTDAVRGVHKAPANELVRGALNLSYQLTRAEQGELNQAGVNCIRLFHREGIRVWGARTVAAGSSEWRYLNVRRLFNMIKESIALNTRWIVFEPNDYSLWKSIRRDISAFLTRLWRDGALMGRTPEEAFFVKCDAETNPPEVIDAGQVVTLIGIAPVKPAEFIIFRISQKQAGASVESNGGTHA